MKRETLPKLWEKSSTGGTLIRSTTGTHLFTCHTPLDVRSYRFDRYGCTIGTWGLTSTGTIETTYVYPWTNPHAPDSYIVSLRVCNYTVPWEIEYHHTGIFKEALLRHGGSIQHIDKASAEFFISIARECLSEKHLVEVYGPSEYMAQPYALPQ